MAFYKMAIADLANYTIGFPFGLKFLLPDREDFSEEKDEFSLTRLLYVLNRPAVLKYQGKHNKQIVLMSAEKFYNKIEDFKIDADLKHRLIRTGVICSSDFSVLKNEFFLKDEDFIPLKRFDPARQEADDIPDTSISDSNINFLPYIPPKGVPRRVPKKLEFFDTAKSSQFEDEPSNSKSKEIIFIKEFKRENLGGAIKRDVSSLTVSSSGTRGSEWTMESISSRRRRSPRRNEQERTFNLYDGTFDNDDFSWLESSPGSENMHSTISDASSNTASSRSRAEWERNRAEWDSAGGREPMTNEELFRDCGANFHSKQFPSLERYLNIGLSFTTTPQIGGGALSLETPQTPQIDPLVVGAPVPPKENKEFFTIKAFESDDVGALPQTPQIDDLAVGAPVPPKENKEFITIKAVKSEDDGAMSQTSQIDDLAVGADVPPKENKELITIKAFKSDDDGAMSQTSQIDDLSVGADVPPKENKELITIKAFKPEDDGAMSQTSQIDDVAVGAAVPPKENKEFITIKAFKAEDVGAFKSEECVNLAGFLDDDDDDNNKVGILKSEEVVNLGEFLDNNGDDDVEETAQDHGDEADTTIKNNDDENVADTTLKAEEGELESIPEGDQE